MIRPIFTLASVITLAACATAQTETQSSDFGVDVDTMGACVKENASAGEMEALAAGGDMATSTTAAILARPGTQTCLEARGVDLSQFS